MSIGPPGLGGSQARQIVTTVDESLTLPDPALYTLPSIIVSKTDGQVWTRGILSHQIGVGAPGGTFSDLEPDGLFRGVGTLQNHVSPGTAVVGELIYFTDQHRWYKSVRFTPSHDPVWQQQTAAPANIPISTVSKAMVWLGPQLDAATAAAAIHALPSVVDTTVYAADIEAALQYILGSDYTAGDPIFQTDPHWDRVDLA